MEIVTRKTAQGKVSPQAIKKPQKDNKKKETKVVRVEGVEDPTDASE